MATRVIELVGPEGFIHGWIFVGVPGVGGKVFHPSLGHGTVTGHSGSHATVRFARGTHTFPARTGKGPGRLSQHATGSTGSANSAAARLARARASGLTGKGDTAALGLQAEVHVESYKDGSKWISKKLPTVDDAEREVLAGKVSDVIGAGAPAVIRSGNDHIHEPLVAGKPAVTLWRDDLTQQEMEDAAHHAISLLSTPEGKRIGLLDTLIGNRDRGLRNWMISPAGKPVPIDHNTSWTEAKLGTESPFVKDLRPSDFTAAQLDKWEAGLTALRPSLSAYQQEMLTRTLAALKSFRHG